MEHAFYTGLYEQVLAADVSTLSSADSDRARQLQIRSKIALGKAREVAAQLSSDKDPISQALAVYAAHVAGEPGAAQKANDIGSGPVETHIKALIQAREGLYSSALQLLEGASNSLDCMLLQVHIFLAEGSVSKAQQVVKAARNWANDHVAFNLAEAWTCLAAEDDADSAQKAYYIFEENNSFAASPRSALGETVAQLELRRFPEATESIKPALVGGSSDALATATALAAIQGEAPPTSLVWPDIKAKEELFDRVAAKYTLKA